VKEYGFDAKEHKQYVECVLSCFINLKLYDNVKCVGCQPLCKLAKDHQLLGPMVMVREYDLPVDHLACKMYVICIELYKLEVLYRTLCAHNDGIKKKGSS